MFIEETTNYKIVVVGNALKDLLDKQLKTIGLHGGQTFILFLLWREDGQSQIAIAKKLNLSAPTINKMVKSLEASGFVKSRKCEQDKRAMRIYLTEKGFECKESVEAIVETSDRNFAAWLTPTENLIFLQILDKLKENLFPAKQNFLKK